MMRRREEYCARIIQTAWRQCVLDSRERRRLEAEQEVTTTKPHVVFATVPINEPARDGDVAAPLDSISEMSAGSSTEEPNKTEQPPPVSTTL